MNRSGFTARTPAAAVLAAAAASGLVLAGCGNSSGSGTSPASGSGASASGAAAASPASNSAPGAGTSVSSALFPLAVGNKWVYVMKGERGTVTNQVIALAPAAGGTKATLRSRESLGGAPTTTTSAIIIHSDGSIAVPVTQLGSSSFKLKSGSVIWPSAAQLASGQPHYDTLVISMDMAGQRSTVRAHVVVKGEGTQTVSVPAGTYQATLINEAMTEKFSGISVTLDIRTWVANGVGPVKDEVTSATAGGRTMVSLVEELKSFTKG